ncbi:TonB-dependent receptor [Mucilaginibacter gynuensis]|uniref:TonB-dependent receptor n=1 Tax=Mucilaginibacter gynuensis TaxID=1302236 RepID=A0ABP8FZX0_9SPHI
MKIYRLFCALILLVFTAGGTYAQSNYIVTGTVKDSTGTTLPGSTVKLISARDTVLTAADINGQFSIKATATGTYNLQIQSIGYQTLKKSIVISSGQTALGNMVLATESKLLAGVNIVEVTPVKIKEDTVEYNAAAYKVRDGAPVEDVLKKLPGVEVDKSGNVTAQGKSVTKVRVNGKDFFGGDVKTATQNLPADIIQNIQIIDDYGDQANLTGLKTGESEKVLNITVKADKNYGYFGQTSFGEGADAQQGVLSKDEANRYVASANVFSFNGDRQLAFLGNLNNTNTNLFTFGGGGPRSGGPGGRQQDGASASSGGITTARSLGFNYRDQWSKTVSAYGSYSFSDNTVNTLSSTIQTNTSLTDPSVNNIGSNQTDSKKNHRFNFNIEYKPDAANYLKFTPTVTYAGVNTDQSGSSNLIRNGETITDYNFNSISNSSSPNYGANLLYNHKFNTTGRNFSVNISGGRADVNKYQNPVYTYTSGVANTPLNQQINTDVKLDSVGAALSYIEPLSTKSFLEANYAYHYAYTTSDKATDTLNLTTNQLDRYGLLSNNYNFAFITNRLGLNYRFIDKKYNYTLGIAAQPTTLNGNSVTTGVQTHVTTFNIAPSARFIYNFSRSQSLSLNYSGASNQPSYSVLQPVTDFSNASYPTQGNADLKPEFNNNLSIRYNKFNFESGNVLFTNLSFTKTDNKIVANTITYPKLYAPDSKLAGTILTQYLNADGFYSGSGSYTYSKPFEKRKYTLSFNGNVSYNNNISYISNIDADSYAMTSQKNIAKSLVLTQGLRFRTDLTDIIDAELNGSYSLTNTSNSIAQANVNNRFSTINLGVNGKNYLWKDWTLSYDYTKIIYKGYTGATNPNVLNAYVERRFLKQNTGTIRLAAYDLFNQNTAFSNTPSGSYITQTNSNKLGRYFLLSFTLRLQKFAGKRPGPPDGGPGGPGGGGMRPEGGPPPGV